MTPNLRAGWADEQRPSIHARRLLPRATPPTHPQPRPQRGKLARLVHATTTNPALRGAAIPPTTTNNSTTTRPPNQAASLTLDRIERDAHDLILFADGAEEAGLVAYAQRARCLARDTLQIIGELRDERRLRIVMQDQRDRARELMSK